ncbi:MAG: hypothetical protein KDF49_11985, partial [Nitrosomonas sp.]|nr:hypothetical protein [Nitrosomonas sp.]
QDEIAGFIDNTAFADSDQTDPVADTEQVPLVIQRLVLNKQVVDVDAAGDGILNAAGDIIDYNILVSNAGNMVLTNIVVIDPLTNMSEVIDILAPGGVQNFATSYTLTQADIDSNGTVQDEIAGFIDNTAFADSDQTDPAADTEQVPLVIPQLVLDKQVVSIDAAGDGVLNAAGEVIDYRLVVSNTGNLALTNIVVTDPLTGLNTVIGSLAPEGVQNIPTSYTLTQADIDSNGTVEDSIAGFIDNTATADSDQTVPVSDTVQVPIPRSFVLTAEADSVAEGTALTFTVTASAPVAQDTDVVFTVMPGNSQAADQGTGTTNLSDFVAGTFNPVTVTIPEGGTSATYDVTGIDDGLVESPESYTVQAVVADQTLTQSTNLLDRSNISLTQLYIGFFDAAPGKANLTAFEDVVDSGVTIAQIADYLADHPLFANIMATATTSAEQAEILMGHLGLTPDGVDGSPASQFAEFITASIDSGMGFGSIIYNIVDFLSQGDTLSFEFVEIAELLNNKELVADIYSRNNSSSSLSELQSVLDGVTSRSPSTEAEALAFLQNKGVDTTAQTISLTTNQDNVIGTADNDIFLGPVAITGHPLGNLREETLQSFDIIDGGEGIDTALLEIGATDAVTINPAIANVENLDITSLSADTLDMSQIIGATNVNSISSIDALSLNNVGNIIGLGLRNTNSVTTVNYTDDALSGSNDFMSLNLENAGGVIGINNPSPMTFSVDVLNISSSGLRNNVTLSGEALIATHTINISGPSDLNLTYTVPTAVPDIFRVDARTSAGVSSGNHVLDFSQQSEETFVFGGFGSEIISTGSFGDTIFAGAGDDTIFGNFGDDLITGGSGNDTINGQEGADSLNGDTGDDIINGGSGNDSITGGFGADELDGGDGNDTFIFGAGDSLNTSLDRINNIGIGDILDFDLAIDPLNGTDLTFLGFSASSGITSTSLADDIRNAVINNDNAFDNSGDTVYLRLNGNSIAGSDAWYIVQRGHDDDIFTYDAGSDTVIALVGYPPTVPDGFFATLDIVDGNLQVAQELLPPAG